MKAYQITQWGQPLEERDLEIPKPKGTEVLLKVTACGVCHSDIHIWDGFFDLGGGKKVTLEDRGLKLPFTLGHEPLGEVAGLGPGATGVSIGEKRIAYPWIGCGQCDVCKRDQELICMNPITIGTRRNGGYAEYLIVPHPKYLVPYDGVDEAVAATAACSGITAYSALKKVRHLRSDESLLIVGAGGVGLAGIGMAKAVVKAKIIVAEIDPAKRAAALEAGADVVLDNSDPSAKEELISLTNGGPNAAIDFVGAPATVEFAFGVMAKGASLVLVGLYGGAAQLSTSLFPLKVNNILGSYVGTQQDLVELLQLIREGKVKPVPLVRRPLREAPQAIQELREGKALGRYVLIND